LGIRRFARGGFLGPHSPTQNRGKSYSFRVTGTFWSEVRDFIPDCYYRWNLGPSFWTGDKREIHGMAPSSLSREENSNIFRQRTRSWWLSSGTVKDWFLWLRCREGRQINSDAYVTTRTELRKRFKRVRPHNNPTEISLQHDNASPHASLKNREDVTKFSWTVKFHPPCCPSPAPSDWQLFGAWRIQPAVRSLRLVAMFSAQ